MKTPLVSVILPTYKEALFLERAINSVQAQTYANWELLIIDDGLYQDAVQSIEKKQESDKRIRYYKNEKNSGIQKSLNKGITEAGGEYIARIDDDDEWIEANKLQRQVTFFEHNPEHVLVGTSAIIVDNTDALMGTYILPQTDEQIRSRILLKNCFLHPSVMMRADAVKKIGGYPEEENVKHIEDYALWLALGQIGKLANLPSVSVKLTVHEQSLTAQNRILQTIRMRSLIKVYKNKYPKFILGYVLLTLRLVGFKLLSVIPIPQSFLYFIQKAYKSL